MEQNIRHSSHWNQLSMQIYLLSIHPSSYLATYLFIYIWKISSWKVPKFDERHEPTEPYNNRSKKKKKILRAKHQNKWHIT
jgi:hypothetical protein